MGIWSTMKNSYLQLVALWFVHMLVWAEMLQDSLKQL